jgi:peptidoglycan/xylan/chitin deacetylase (PgdA/CDA1 family)
LDDGLASNYHFAFPILNRYQFPASLFVATEFVDQGAWLWPDRLEYALGKTRHTSVATDLTGASLTWSLTTTSDRVQTIRSLGAQFKELPQEMLHSKLAALEATVECSLARCAKPPKIYHPLTWDQIREMDASGLITIGAHTHRHLILGRCTPETAAFEMATSCTLLQQQLGKHPTIFAYPNGQCGDFNRTTEDLLEAFQIEAAVTTQPGFNQSTSTTNPLALRRFGQPDTPAHLEFILSDTAGFLKHTLRRTTRLAALTASTAFLPSIPLIPSTPADEDKDTASSHLQSFPTH